MVTGPSRVASDVVGMKSAWRACRNSQSATTALVALREGLIVVRGVRRGPSDSAAMLFVEALERSLLVVPGECVTQCCSCKWSSSESELLRVLDSLQPNHLQVYKKS